MFILSMFSVALQAKMPKLLWFQIVKCHVLILLFVIYDKQTFSIFGLSNQSSVSHFAECVTIF